MQPNVIGTITSWSGSVANIPSGYALCDGTNGTPDLRDRFVPGAGDSYAPGATGGAVNHTHPFTANGHNHDLSGPGAMPTVGVNLATTDTQTIAGTTDAGNVLPLYYALAYIMFIGD